MANALDLLFHAVRPNYDDAKYQSAVVAIQQALSAISYTPIIASDGINSDDLFAQLAQDPHKHEPLNGLIEKLYIEMQRTHCYGPCPVYSVSATVDGAVNFVGEKFVEVKGTKPYTVDPERIKLIAREAYSFGFFELDQDTLDSCPESMTDADSVILTIHANDLENTLNHYYGCRGLKVYGKIETLADRIDELLETEQWIGKPQRF